MFSISYCTWMRVRNWDVLLTKIQLFLLWNDSQKQVYQEVEQIRQQTHIEMSTKEVQMGLVNTFMTDYHTTKFEIKHSFPILLGTMIFEIIYQTIHNALNLSSFNTWAQYHLISAVLIKWTVIQPDFKVQHKQCKQKFKIRKPKLLLCTNCFHILRAQNCFQMQ